MTVAKGQVGLVIPRVKRKERKYFRKGRQKRGRMGWLKGLGVARPKNPDPENRYEKQKGKFEKKREKYANQCHSSFFKEEKFGEATGVVNSQRNGGEEKGGIEANTQYKSKKTGIIN